MEYMNFENPDTISDAESEIHGNESSSYEQFGFLLRKAMVRVEEREDDTHVNMIKNVFLTGARKFGNDARIVAMHRHSRLGLAGESRAERFRIFSEAVAKKNRGAANIKYGWYGGSKDEISEILSYGFCRCKRKSYGHGVYLSASKFCIDCVPSSTADENGLRHMLLCCVILGNTEEVCAGSEQFHPSCTQFDSGVDNLSAPTKYIIWSPYINSHILPSFVISFTVTPSSSERFPSLKNLERSHDATIRSSTGELPTSSRRDAATYSSNSKSKTNFSKLMEELSKHLDSSKMSSIAKVYDEYQRNKTTFTQMVQNLKTIVGDEVLQAAAKEILRQKNANSLQNRDNMIRSSAEEVSRTPTGCAATNSSNSIIIPIPNLIKILARDMDFSKRVLVAEVYNKLLRKTITKAEMIRSLMTIAGEELRAALKEMMDIKPIKPL